MRVSMKKMYCNVAVVLSLMFVAVGCKQQESAEAVNAAPVKVKTMKIESVEANIGQHYSGTVEEVKGSTLSFPVLGTIQQLNVSTGQRVGSGQLIATVDETTLLNAYDAAASVLEQAEDAYWRMKQLHDNNSLPEIQWVEAQNSLRQARSAEQIAKKNLEDSKLYAPFSGVISEKSVEVGQNVMPGSPVVKLVAVDRVKVSISVPENEISHVATGQSVNIVVSALDGKTFEGKVVEKNVSANRLSRSYEVKALVENPSGELLPGMICDLFIGTDESREVIELPCNVIQLDSDNQSFVWVNDGGRAAKRVIETGMLSKDGIVVTGGLAVGDEVLVEGQQKVSEQMSIMVEE